MASAAYRAGEALTDERYHLTHDYTRKHGIAHAEILAPPGSPAWVFERETLWNRVEAGENRRDAQLAREIEVGLPVELSHAESVGLLREYVQGEFVAKGMIADCAIHRDNPGNPHAHILLTLRKATESGFGLKERTWNARANLLEWRAAWAERSNEHLAGAGFAIRIDHRSLAAQGIELIPGRKIGIGKDRQDEPGLPRSVTDRIAENARIARENGRAIVGNPTVALEALVRQRATFTHQDIAKFLHTRTDGAAQFEAAYLKVTTSPELVALGVDEADRMRYTTRSMLEAEQSLLRRSRVLAGRPGHEVVPSRQASVLTLSVMGDERRPAMAHLMAEGDLKVLVAAAGSAKGMVLAAARQAWEAEGLKVRGVAPSRVAAENLGMASGISSRSLGSVEDAWDNRRHPLTDQDVLVVDEAGLVGTFQWERMLNAAETAHAKVVVLGSSEQLHAVEAGAALRGIAEEAGFMELTPGWPQTETWARDAAQALARGDTEAGLRAYEQQGWVLATDTQAEARELLLDRWDADERAAPRHSRLMLASTREEVRELNRAAHERRKLRHELGSTESFSTSGGEREFSVNDRIAFLRHDRGLKVTSGMLGTVEAIDRGVLQIRLDDPEETRTVVDARDYPHLDYGYAATIYRTRSTTVDRSYVLASRHFDRHTTQVALSRHRESAIMVYSRAEFSAGAESAGVLDAAGTRARFYTSMSRTRSDELAHEYLERQPEAAIDVSMVRPASPRPLTPDEVQAAARERWLAYRARIAAGQDPGLGRSTGQEQGNTQEHGLGHDQPDDDLSL